MPVRRYQENNIKDFEKRINFLKFLIFLIFFVVLIRIFFLQYIDYKKYYEMSLDNKVKLIDKSALRGTIYDRNGIILARNIPSFDLAIIPSGIDYSDFNMIDQLGLIFDESRESIVDDLKSVPHTKGTKAVILRRGITRNEVARIEENSDIFKQIEIIVAEKRFYPFRDLASQVIGYTGFPSSEDIAEKKRLSLNTFIGKSGIEKYYDELLRGKDGWYAVLKDTYGRIKKTSSFAGEEIQRLSVQPEAGKDIQLTIDVELQSFAEKLLEGRKGAIVVLDIHTGEILAMASKPSFDPNIFVEGISRREWNDLIKAEGNPFLNRGCSTAYPPGSIFKVVTAIAALENGKINKFTHYRCKGSMIIGNRLFHCWNKAGHGNIDVIDAIRNSCNIFFYNVGRNLGSNEILRFAKMFGFGVKSGIDYPFESSGSLPNLDGKKKSKTKDIEAPLLAIGQGDLTITPLQAARAMATIASDGIMPVPHFLKGKTVKYEKINISEQTLNLIKKALFSVVNRGGTGINARLENIAVCGKTGTAQVASSYTTGVYKEKGIPLPEKLRDHAWFAGFAPYKNPEISFAIFVEHGGSGGAAAAPLARELLNFYFNLDKDKTEKSISNI
ncbi:MAG: penicillin-binding protein 2 [Candidatus Schekmanbacteria bacterium]|nr:MAG: penicillin-binding protein 2 [Candidatus Schekmanbacteria bacterium]